MAESSVNLSAPDFSRGVPIGDLPSKGILAGRVGDEPVLLGLIDGEICAVGGSCTHYGALLANGLVIDGTIRCPLHHACFDLRSGAALAAPAFAPLARWRPVVEDGLVFVREKETLADAASARPAIALSDRPREIVIVGGGAAGLACADGLRQAGYDGGLTMVSADEAPPYDRPNLSKDYLAGTAPEEWMALRDAGHYRDSGIDLRLGTMAVEIDIDARVVLDSKGEAFPFDRLLLATGSTPVRLNLPGFDRANVHLLRSLADARAIIARAAPGARGAIVGSSFIGLEAAAALRARGVEVDLVSSEAVPLSRVLDPIIGRWLRHRHEERGVRFHLGQSLSGFDGRSLILDDGRQLAVDFVLLGVGVRPDVTLAASAGLAVDNGIVVDQYLETSSPGIFAAGDVACYPEAGGGRRLRIEHWVTAQRQGQVAAANMLGGRQPFRAIPFFWTEQYGTALRYVGHAQRWTSVEIDGSIDDGAFTARLYDGATLVASASVGRDRQNLEDEVRLEALIASAHDYSGSRPCAR